MLKNIDSLAVVSWITAIGDTRSRENDVPAASQGSHQITEVTGSGGGVREEVGQDMPAGV